MEILKDRGENKPAAFRKSKGTIRQPYTLYLINAAIRAHRIGEEAVNNFQIQVMDILKDLILRYTNGESTSIRVDTAEDILQSIFYCIDAGLQSLNDHEAALGIIRSGSARRAYEDGLARVTACFKESRAIYLKLKKNRLRVGLEAYDLTIDEGLAIFFDRYGPVFHAHHTMASIDYPLLFDDMSVKGVFYMKAYMETLLLENRFCSLFPDEEIKRVLAALGRIYKIDYTRTLTNIFELVLNAVFFSVISEETPVTLEMTREKYRVLESKLGGTGTFDLELLVDEGFHKVIHGLQIKEEKLTEYILKYGSTLKTRLAFALETGSLKKLALQGEDASAQINRQIFIDGERMSNESFRKLAAKLSKEQDMKAKAGMIRSEVHSLEDLTDILEAGCFFGEEYFYLFSRLNEQELALLAGVVFADEMREGTIDLSKSLSFGITAGVEWKEMLAEFFGKLTADKIKLVEACMNDMACG